MSLNEDGTPLERPEQFAGRKLLAGSSGTGAPDERPEK